MINQQYFPSDSLTKLEKLMEQLYPEKQDKQLELVTKEIRRIQVFLDKPVILNQPH